MVGSPAAAVRSVAVVGANGKTGRAVAAALRGRGVSVAAIGRAELEDLPAVLAHADALYLTAPNMYEDEPAFVDRVLAAAAGVGVRAVPPHSRPDRLPP